MQNRVLGRNRPHILPQQLVQQLLNSPLMLLTRRRLNHQINQMRYTFQDLIEKVRLPFVHRRYSEQLPNLNDIVRHHLKRRENVVEPLLGIVLLVQTRLDIIVHHQSYKRLGRETGVRVQNGVLLDSNLEHAPPQVDAALVPHHVSVRCAPIH